MTSFTRQPVTTSSLHLCGEQVAKNFISRQSLTRARLSHCPQPKTMATKLGLQCIPATCQSIKLLSECRLMARLGTEPYVTSNDFVSPAYCITYVKTPVRLTSSKALFTRSAKNVNFMLLPYAEPSQHCHTSQA